MKLKFVAKNKKAPAVGRVLFAISLLSALYSLLSAPIFAQTEFGAGEEEGSVATIQGFEKIFSNLITVSLAFGGIVLFVMFLTAGFKYLTSQGDPKAIESAKGTLNHAIIGFIILILAFVFLAIIHQITGAQITNFRTRVR